MEAQSFLEQPVIIAAAVIVLGFVVGYLVGRLNEELLTAAGVPDAVEGTPFERSAQSLGTSTVKIVARLSSWFVYGIAILTAITIAQLIDTDRFWGAVTFFLPKVFVAVFIFVVGFIIADKAELMVGEYLRSVKLPEASLIPRVVKYSILFVVIVLALAQLNVNVSALLVLLVVYMAGLVLVGTFAFKDFLISSAVGIYLLLNQPYGIGDRIRVDGRSGIVQEVDIFVTVVESDDEEFVIPNRQVFEAGIVKLRESTESE